MDKFWKVQRPGGLNAIRYSTLGEAQEEAKRLSIQHPGTDFIVLESIGHFRKENPVWTPHHGAAK